jgi:RNA polymerase primary sigma factor
VSKKIIFTDHSNTLLTTYLKEISKYKILSPEEIIRLVVEAQKGDKIARDTVVKSNLRFVVTIAKQFQNRGVPLMDLISEGNIGLTVAIDKFDPEKGVAFLSYAIWWIRQKIYGAIYWQGREIRLPMSQQLAMNKILDTTNRFMQIHNRYPSAEEIAEMSGIDVRDVDYLAQFNNKLVSVDDYIGGDEENNQVCDIIPDGEPPLEDEVNKEYVLDELSKLLDKLTCRESDLIKLLFGINMPAVAPAIVADMYGVGLERVRQMKDGALKKLRRRFTPKLKNLMLNG